MYQNTIEESEQVPELRNLYLGPGHELQTVSVGHQAEGSEVRCHVFLNRFRGSPGSFCASGNRRLSHKESSSVHRHVLHTDPCNADLPQ